MDEERYDARREAIMLALDMKPKTGEDLINLAKMIEAYLKGDKDEH